MRGGLRFVELWTGLTGTVVATVLESRETVAENAADALAIL